MCVFSAHLSIVPLVWCCGIYAVECGVLLIVPISTFLYTLPFLHCYHHRTIRELDRHSVSEDFGFRSKHLLRGIIVMSWTYSFLRRVVTSCRCTWPLYTFVFVTCPGVMLVSLILDIRHPVTSSIWEYSCYPWWMTMDAVDVVVISFSSTESLYIEWIWE